MLTTVWTSFILWCLILLMTSGISTMFSLPTCSRTWSMVMNVPVLPTPALRESTPERERERERERENKRIEVPKKSTPDHYKPAVYHQRSFFRLVFFDHSPVEGQERSGIVWYSMIRPGSEVELSYFQRTS